MTREAFLEVVNTWSELISLCEEYDCDECARVRDTEMYDDYMNSELFNRVRDEIDWEDIKSWLEDAPQGYDYYDYDELYDRFSGLDEEDFRRYKGYVLSWMENEGVFEEEEDEYDEETDDEADEDTSLQEYEPDYECEPPEEPVSIGELFRLCNAEMAEAGMRAVKTN